MQNLTLQTNPATGKRIIFLNASALKYSACQRRLAWAIGYGLGNHTSVAAEYGVAFHKFAAERLESGDYSKALSLALDYYKTIDTKDDYRTIEHLLQTCIAYDQEYKYDSFQVLRDTDGHAVVEKSFAIEADDLLPVNCPYHLVLVGTIDALGIDSFGNHVLMDHKTTSVFKRDTYLDGYRTSVQLKFYNCVLLRHRTKFGELFDFDFGCQVNGIFLSKDPLKTKFQRGDFIRYSKETMAEFENLLRLTVWELAASLDTEPAPTGMIHDVCNSHFGLCPFFEGCSNPDVKGWLELQEKKVYNPLER